MAEQKRHPDLLKGLPKRNPQRRKEYKRRYGYWWRKQNPSYMTDYGRAYNG